MHPESAARGPESAEEPRRGPERGPGFVCMPTDLLSFLAQLLLDLTRGLAQLLMSLAQF